MLTRLRLVRLRQFPVRKYRGNGSRSTGAGLHAKIAGVCHNPGPERLNTAVAENRKVRWEAERAADNKSNQ